MMTSEVETSSCQTFNRVLSPHERCIRGDNNNNNKTKNNNNNNVRNIHVAFEKNLNVFVRDHLEKTTVVSVENGDDSTNKSSVSKIEEPRLSSSSSIGSEPDPNSPHPGQQDKNTSRKETMPASSLVQIWEARTTQQPPNQVDSRTSSSGSNVLESSESLNEEPVKEPETIQPIQEGNNEDEKEEEAESDSQSVSGEKEREGVRVMDIIRKLSTDTEPTANNDNASNCNDNGKEVHTPTTETRSFPQVTCSPRIRGRQAFADLLILMMRDREKELACLLDRHCVSKFTHKGRIQSTLRIRCYERCIAIQDKYRSKSWAAGTDLNRSPRGSGVMHLLKEKNKTNSGNIETGAQSSSVSSRGRVMDKDFHKVLEKKVVEETMEKIDVKEVQEVATAKKVVLGEILENKNGLKKSTGETIKKEVAERRGEKRETKAQEVVYAVKTAKKAVLSEILENKDGLNKSTGETIKKESAEKRGEKREMMEKPVAREGLEGRGEKPELTKETAKKEVLSERAEDKSGLKKPAGETIQKEIIERRGEKGETKEKAIVKEHVQGNALVGIAEKVNIWSSEEKISRRRWTEKGKTESKANTERVDKNDVLEEATRRISGERSITTSSPEKEVRRKEKEDCVSVETKSREIGDPQQATAQEEEKVVQETTSKSDLNETTNNKNGLKKPTEKESKEGREMEERVEGNTLMGIAEKVNMWNSKAKKNRRRYSMDKGKGKAHTWRNEAARRIINVETSTTSKETVEKVVGTQEIKDKREIMCESEEKGRRKKEGELCSEEAKSKDIIEVKIMSSQEVKPAQESACHVSPERAKEISSSPQGLEAKSTKETDGNNFQENRIEEESASERPKENSSQHDGIRESEDEETNKEECEEKREDVKEVTIEFANEVEEDEEGEEDDYEDYGDFDDYNGEISTDWIYDIARPRSYWEELRKERYLEVLNTESEKKDICNLIQSRTVSNFLTSDLRERIDNLMINLVHNHLGVSIHQEEEDEKDKEEEEEWVEECSARNQENNETEEEPEETNLETASDGGSQYSARSSSTLMVSWSFRDHEPTASLPLPEPSVATNQSTQEMQMINDLMGQMEKLQREMLELRNTVKSCTDMQLHYQKSVTQDLSHSGSSAEERVETKNPLKRKCCVCSEMPIDSLLYRCGHMCTCLKCAHELQWSSKKCPICMAPIVDVVRAFLDA